MQVRFAGPQPEEEGGEVPEVAPVGFVQDLNASQRIFSWAGVSFGEQEAYRLQKSLKKFAAETNASQTRFFGKITGTQNDYYIVEATVEGGDDDAADGEEKEPGFDAKGATGVNQFTYFVSKDSMSSWTKLPDISPSQIKAARNIKVLFTGDLDRKIFTNPFFEGQEKHYLRAQIARIIQSTTLLPKGLWKATEDSETREIEAVEPEEGQNLIPNTSQMKDPAMWVHAKKSILNNCKTIHVQPTAPEGFEGEWDDETEMKKVVSADPYEPLLKPITDDSKIQITKAMS